MDFFIDTIEDDLDREFINTDKVKKDIIKILSRWGKNFSEAPCIVKEELRRLIHLIGNNQDELENIASACKDFGIFRGDSHVA